MEARATIKAQFRRYAPELSLLLWAVWKPIGADVPLDEYETYVPGVWTLLREQADADAIAAHLDGIATTRMGLGAGSGRVAAGCLKQWWYWRFEYPQQIQG